MPPYLLVLRLLLVLLLIFRRVPSCPVVFIDIVVVHHCRVSLINRRLPHVASPGIAAIAAVVAPVVVAVPAWDNGQGEGAAAGALGLV
jgi:hypothetical protein